MSILGIIMYEVLLVLLKLELYRVLLLQLLILVEGFIFAELNLPLDLVLEPPLPEISSFEVVLKSLFERTSVAPGVALKVAPAML